MQQDQFVNISVRMPQRLYKKLKALSMQSDRPGIVSETLRLLIESTDQLPQRQYIKKHNRVAQVSDAQHDTVGV